MHRHCLLNSQFYQFPAANSVSAAIASDSQRLHAQFMNQAYDQDVLHLHLFYPYSNQVLANGRGCWTA